MGFSVISLNVDSIVYGGRRSLLLNFIEQTNADIYLIQETKLDNKINFSIHNYNVIRTDNIRGMGGTAIIVRSSIPIRYPKFYNDIIQATSVEFQYGGGWANVVSCYFPPNRNLTIDNFNEFFSYFPKSLIGGDVNARHTSFGDISSNSYGNHLINSSNTLGFNIISPGLPSCYRCEYGSFIDKFINYDFPIIFSNIINIPSFSDHFAISVSLSIPNVQNSPRVNKQFHLADMDKINHALLLKSKQLLVPLNSNLDVSDLEQITVNFADITKDVINKYTPTNKISHRIILSPNVKIMQAKCKALSRKLQRLGYTGQHFTRIQIIKQISLLKGMIKNAVQSETGKFYSNIYDSISNNRDAFKVIKRFTGHKIRPNIPGCLFSDENKQNAIAGDVNIANSLAQQFANNHLLTFDNGSIIDDDVSDAIENLSNNNDAIIFNNQITPVIHSNEDLVHINTLLPENQRGILTSCDEVNNIIKSRPNKKSTGFDDLPFFIIKQFSPSIILFLTILFNHLLSVAYFPRSWKTALITAIPKPGKDSTIISNWRPISQLLCIAKIFEKIIAVRTCAHIGSLDILRNQFGFLPGHSTEHALCRIQNDIINGLNNKMITSMVALDLRAAFDTVWHDGLIYKMMKLNFNPFIIKIIRSLLASRRFAVRLANVVSEWHDMLCGTPQGSVISPILFNLFMYDIPINENVKLTQFADDTTIHITHKLPKVAENFLNAYLMDLLAYFNKWKLMLNVTKTEFINVMGQVVDTNAYFRKKCRDMSIKLDGEIIPHSNDIRLLGVQFQTNARFTKNVNIRINKARRAKFAISRILTNRFIEKKIKIGIYKIYIRSILTYAAPIWCLQPFISSHQMELMRIFERGCLRSATNAKRAIGSFKHIKISEIYNAANCARIDRFISYRHHSFFHKCKNSNLIKLRTILDCQDQIYGRYNVITHIHDLHDSGQLVLNDQILIFHTRYNRGNGLVYNTGQ